MRIIWLVLALGIAANAQAQDTGGSFGGGDWGSGSDYGSSGGSDYGSSSYGSSSSDYGSSGSGGGSSPVAGLCGIVIVFGFFFAVSWIQGAVKRRFGAGQAGRAWSTVDLTALRLAIDWRARPFVQKKLDALARSGATRDKAGLVRLLRETSAMLESVRVAWLYADVSNYRPMSQAMAQGTFQQLAIDARSRFRRELVRNADGHVESQSAGVQRARPEEGEGVVVITLVVAARRELLDVGRATDASEIAQLLASLRTLDEQHLVALEVVWSPAAEEDRMSTAELSALYPSLERMSERDVGGRVFCGYCGGPYADELAKCPHCGAPHAG